MEPRNGKKEDAEIRGEVAVKNGGMETWQKALLNLSMDLSNRRFPTIK